MLKFRGVILNPKTTAGYVFLHVGCIGVFWVGDIATGLATLLVTYVIRMFILSAGYHRYFAHRAYRTSRAVQFLIGLSGLLTMQRGPIWWAATHRAHRARTALATTDH